LAESIYLNQASLGLIGRPAVEAMHRFIDGVGRHGNVYMSDEDEVAFLDTLRHRAARLFHTETRQIAILSSASELLGQLPFLLPMPSEAKVVAVGTDFPAITRPWLRLFERGGCRLGFVDDNPESDLTTDLIARIDEHTSLVAVSSVQVAIGALAPAILDQTPPLPGWMGAPDPFEVDATRMLCANDARRYTQSTMSYVSVVGLATAMDQLLTTGMEKLEHHAERLAHLLVGAVEPLGWHPFRHLDDHAASPHIISLGRQGDGLARTLDRLRAIGIVCSTRAGRLRVSLAPYNDEDDIAALVDALV